MTTWRNGWGHPWQGPSEGLAVAWAISQSLEWHCWILRGSYQAFLEPSWTGRLGDVVCASPHILGYTHAEKNFGNTAVNKARFHTMQSANSALKVWPWKKIGPQYQFFCSGRRVKILSVQTASIKTVVWWCCYTLITLDENLKYHEPTWMSILSETKKQ